MKKFAIMQPYLFPYIGYFQTMDIVDEYVIYDDVQFIKGGWINRNNMLIGKNKQLFSVPLLGASANKLINEIEVQHDLSKLEKTLAMAYAKAPHRAAVLDLLHDTFEYPDKNLARFTGNSIQRIAEYLGMTTRFLYSSELHKDTSLRAQAKVIAICQERGATDYYNAIGGKELYDRASFEAAGLHLHFVRSELVPYKQNGKQFVPGLSVIDVMMFNAVEEVRDLLVRYTLE